MKIRCKAQGDKPMNVINSTGKTVRYVIAGALASALLAGAANAGRAIDPVATTAKAQAALAKGKAEQAIGLAEAAVSAAPRDGAARIVLAQAYLKAGRFDSAATTFNDAMELGDNSPRTALALALSNAAAGRNHEAVAILDDWREAIPASDLGLAYALAGQGGRGVAILADALRSGENTAKLRQNLAYAYALDGRWREARTMIAQDLPADKVDARVSEWASQARPEEGQRRVATLLGVPMRADAGQPSALALANSPAAQQAAVESTASQPTAELAAATPAPAPEAAPAPAPAPASTQSFASAFADQPANPAFVANHVVQILPVSGQTAMRAVPVRSDGSSFTPRAASVSGGTHLVQLGSFSSEQGARRAWGIFAAKNPELRNYRMTITPAVVHGRNFWRVAAAGFNARAASGLCSTVKGRGGACFAYAATNPPPSGVPGRGASGPALARRR